MRTRLFPDDFEVPTEGSIGPYSIHPITVAEVLEDWLVVTSNAEAIARQRGVGTRKEWPFVCSLEENLKDVAWLELCAHYRQLFGFILRDQNEKYAGFVYIYPIEFLFPELAGEYDVDLSFWIIQAEQDAGKYEDAYQSILNWFTGNWPVESGRIRMRNPATLNPL